MSNLQNEINLIKIAKIKIKEKLRYLAEKKEQINLLKIKYD